MEVVTYCVSGTHSINYLTICTYFAVGNKTKSLELSLALFSNARANQPNAYLISKDGRGHRHFSGAILCLIYVKLAVAPPNLSQGCSALSEIYILVYPDHGDE